MNKGSMIIETAVILPLVIILVLISVTMILFFVIKTDTDLDLNMEFISSGENNAERAFEITLPFGIRAYACFMGRKREADYGKHIQKSWILRDIFED